MPDICNHVVNGVLLSVTIYTAANLMLISLQYDYVMKMD
jgi:hypothetical protein